MSDYRVIIIAGRPAGASLAIRTGKQNIRGYIVLSQHQGSTRN